MTYDRKRVITKSANLIKLHYEDEDNGSAEERRLYIWASFYNFGEQNNGVHLLGRTAPESFVVEGLPGDSKEKCTKVGLKDLRMTRCAGDVKIRPLITN